MSYNIPRRTLPLETQIREVERRLAEQRLSASAHLAATKERLRNRLSSPVTLLVAFGGGIALGHFTSTPRERASQAPVRTERDTKSAGLLSMLVDALRLAAPIVAMLSAMNTSNPPLASPAEPSVHD